jgi:hypothetical protein
MFLWFWFATLPRISLEETLNLTCLFPTAIKRPSIGQSNLTSTRAEERH